MIEWVFIDVGNVLFNDDPQNFHSYRTVYPAIAARHAQYTFAEMLAQREALAQQGANFILAEIVRRMLPEERPKTIFESLRAFLVENYDRHHLLNRGVVEVLQELRSRWRLGIIANQPAECRASLQRRGLLELFDVVAISDELDLHKPDVRLYQWTIEKAGCDPARSVMIGDRRDNDIAPANAALMRTILLQWADCRSKGWDPDDPMAQAFLDSCDRVPLFSAAAGGPNPDRIVVSLAELPAAVAALSEA